MKGCVAFEIIPIEVDFIKPIVLSFHKTYPDINIILVIENKQEKIKIIKQHPDLSNCGFFCSRQQLLDYYRGVRIFITSEQYRGGIEGIKSYCSFHGQPAKGLTLQHRIANKFEGFFLLGPLQKKAIEEFYYNNYGESPQKPRFHEVGYPKSDDLINKRYKKSVILKELNLPNDKPVILYAPAFNEYASMRENGEEIIKKLIQNKKWSLIVKLAVDCLSPTKNLYATGGIDWFEKLRKYEKEENFRLYKKTNIDPLLEAADVLVTCVSSVAFEFLVLGKPVIYFDTPKFFTHYLKMIFPHDNTELWSNRTTVNAGREYGTIVKDVNELETEIQKAVPLGISEKKALIMREKLIYNPGVASDVAAKKIKELFDQNKYLKKEIIKKNFYSILVKTLSFIKKTRSFFIVILWRIPLLNYKISRSRKTYIDCHKTVNSAKSQGLSVNDYLEKIEDHQKKKGRRNRIINEMLKRNILDIKNKNVLEIGSGTGRFLERVIEFGPKRYEVYETDQAWSGYIKKKYGMNNNVDLIVHDATGVNLNKTPNNSVDLVHAHAVFVYLPIVTAVGYLREISRVIKGGGIVCFDWYYDTDWNLLISRSWEYAGLRFPVVVSRSFIENCFNDLGFVVLDEFTEIHGASFSRYIILKKSIEC